nr:MAG TPA: minor structural protein [Caudoviricetes sp.]
MAIKEILGEKYKDGMTVEEADKVLGEMGAKIFDLSKGEYVGRGRYQTLEADVKAKSEENAALVKQLEELKKGSPEIRAEITKLQDELKAKDEEFSRKYNAREREYLIDDILKDAKPKNLGALKGALNGKFDFEKAEVKDGKVAGLSEILTQLKESDGYLFEDSAPAPRGAGLPPAGKNPNANDGAFNFNFTGVRKKEG